MGLSVDTSQNYLAWGNTEAVTLTSVATSGNTAYALPTAKRRNPTYKEQIPTGGVYGAALLTWLVPNTVLQKVAPSYLIKMADTITANDPISGNPIVWTVLEDAGLNAMRSTWRCITLALTIAFNLQDTISVKRPNYATDAAGGRIYNAGGYTTVYSGIACRLQETHSEPRDERGKRITVKKYLCPVATRLYVTIEDQVIDQNGNVYEIKATHDADRIDQLQQLELERRW